MVLQRRSMPIYDMPEIGIGNKPIDGSSYLFTRTKRDGSSNSNRTPENISAAGSARTNSSTAMSAGACGWKDDCRPPNCVACRMHCRAWRRLKFRAASKSAPTRKLASNPTRFHVEFMPDAPYMVIPGGLI